MLKNAELKLDRADKHILDLERDFRAFIDGNAHSIIVEVSAPLAYAGLDGSVWGTGWAISRSPAGWIRQTSAKSAALLFPSLTQRAAEQPQLPWWNSGWLMRLSAMLTFSHLLELSHIDELSRRAL